MHSFLRKRNLLFPGLFALLAVAVMTPPAASATATAVVKPKPSATGRGFRLFARSLGAITINRIYCGLAATGEVCVDSTNSSTIGGGFWPKGTADQYVFNSGLQIAGVIGADANPEWAGDTTGAFFFDPKGTTQHGEQVEPIYNTTNPEDNAFISDTTGTCNEVCLAAKVPSGDANQELFFPLLRGRAAASQGDVWWLSWDGNPALTAGRPHPLGILVEQRGMGWNFPSGNEDILYFLYTFYNVTARDPAVYAAAGIRDGMDDILARQGAIFQDRNEASYGIEIPDGGYTIENLFAAFSADMDVAEAGANFASVNVPFALGHTYEHTFAPASGWTFDPTIFSPPFFPGSGFVGVKYLKSPEVAGVEVGLTLFSNTINGGAFDDAQNTTQLFRYISNNINPAAGDAPCNTGNAQLTKICFVNNTAPDDMRFFQSSGPLNLGPGQFGTIAVAYIFAAPVAVAGCVGPGTCDLTPGDPRRLSDPATADNANPVDSVAGFTGYAGDANGNGVADQGEFTLPVAGSLLGKALVAQNVFNFGFLLPFAPESPDFFLIPGNNQVTVLWQPSASETTGDPYFAVSNATTITNPETMAIEPNPLFDPNYRQFDVEGYRIYRGRVDSPNELALVAQFDYAGTLIKDFQGQVNPVPGCAPELGIDTACVAPFDSMQAGVAPTVSVDVALVGPVIQVKRGERTTLATGEAIVLRADTAFTGTASGRLPELSDNGVPFAFTDASVRSNLRYFYSVTAFDVNSFQSGPSTIESPRATKSVTPSSSASNVEFANQFEFTILGDDGNPIPTATPGFDVDASTGRFTGRPPANLSVNGAIQEGVLRLAPAIGGNGITARIDSVKVRASNEAYPLDNITAFNCVGQANGQGLCQEYFVTYTVNGSSVQTRTPVRVPILSQAFGDPATVTTGLASGPVPVTETAVQQFGLPPGIQPPAASVALTVPRHGELSSGEQFYSRRALGGISPGGSRWFSGDNETVDDPTYSIRVGQLPGVDTIYSGLSHTDEVPGNGAVNASPVSVCMQMYAYGTTTFGRQADIEVTWGPGGTLASVRDVTHNVNVPLGATPGSNYGFVPDGDGNGMINWVDMAQVEEMAQINAHLAFCGPADGLAVPAPGAGTLMTNAAAVTPVSHQSGGLAPGDFTATGQGFGLYLAGHFHIFQLTGGVLPAEGTKWTLRSVSGPMDAETAPESANPEGYTFTQAPGNPAIAGLQFRFTIPASTVTRATTEADLARVHTVPDPYYVTSQLEQTTDTKIIKFVNLPSDCIIRIYSSSGVLVSLIEHHTTSFGGSEDWNVRNRNGQFVASGVYFYHIESGDARRVGRFTVVNFAQ